MGSTQDEGAQKTCCETHTCLLCPCDDTPLTCARNACCYADLKNPAPDLHTGLFACCLNSILPGCGTLTAGCLKGSRRAMCVGCLTITAALVFLLPEVESVNRTRLAGGFLLVYMFTCAWNCRLVGFLCRTLDEHRPSSFPTAKDCLTVPTVSPIEAICFGILNCIVPGLGAILAGAAGTENRAYGAKAGGYQMLLAAAPFLVFGLQMIVASWGFAAVGLSSSWCSGEGHTSCDMETFRRVPRDSTSTYILILALLLGNLLFYMAVVCQFPNWVWSCAYGYVLIKHNTQLCGQVLPS